MPDRSSFPAGKLLLSILAVLVVVAGYFLYRTYNRQGERMVKVFGWFRDPGAHPEWIILAGERCGSAPMIYPTSGVVGFIWDDSFRIGHRHQGLDIFGGGDLGQTPVMAAYPGYLTRQSDWKSSLIIRVPADPLNPDRQIWTYYTHMADPDGNSFISPDFPPGTYEIYVEAGTLLGYQGNYSGDPGNPTGIHLHFSLVLDDGVGKWLNELKIENTLDPTPYLGLPVNANTNPDQIPVCEDPS